MLSFIYIFDIVNYCGLCFFVGVKHTLMLVAVVVRLYFVIGWDSCF